MVGQYSPEAIAILEKEGPKYQYGSGCLADGVLGAWLALVCGVGSPLDAKKVAGHLQAVHRYNLKRDLTHTPTRSVPATPVGTKAACCYARGPRAASCRCRSCTRTKSGPDRVPGGLAPDADGPGRAGLGRRPHLPRRYDGRVRNPFNEYECGHWYARAMSSYALLQGLSGARYDAVDKVLHLRPNLRGDFRCFLSTATGYGTVGLRSGKPFLDVKSGTIEVREIRAEA